MTWNFQKFAFTPQFLDWAKFFTSTLVKQTLQRINVYYDFDDYMGNLIDSFTPTEILRARKRQSD